jgi:hypothetical protein
VTLEFDLVCVALHVDCRVQVVRLVLVNFGNRAVLSLLLVDGLDQL